MRGIPMLGVLVPCIVTLLSLVPLDASARILHVEVSPKVVTQGDAFVVRVTGAGGETAPSVIVGKNTIVMGVCGTGCFIGIGAVAFDEKPGRYAVKVRDGFGREKKLWITVKKGLFETVRLTLPDGKVNVSPNDLAIVEEENAVLRSLFLTNSERRWEEPFRMPVEGAISTPFGVKRIMNGTWTSVHRGIDIKGREGDEVKAANCGSVVLSRELFFGGKTVIIDHGQGIFTLYMHLSHTFVSVGDHVKKGDVIGFVGSTGRTTGPHLHFGVKVADISVNPVSLMNLRL